MNFENIIGHDASLALTASDAVLLAARSNAATAPLSNRAFTSLPVTPGALVSTEGTTIVVASLFVPKGSGVFLVSFNFSYSLSAADTIGFAAISLNGALASGGNAEGIVGPMVYETSGHPISVSGTSGASAGSYDIIVPTPAIGSLSGNISGPCQLLQHQQGAICLGVATVGGAVITFTSLTALIFELP
jgi:hypothetical protein